jgi:DNA invertase Pin-like site-specific DNA recombinase
MRVPRAAVYTRVSTLDQHPEIQQEELVQYVARRHWTLHKIYTDKGVSGIAEKRPGLDLLLEDCRRRRVDVVVVWKFDRFGRSLKQLVNALELFRKLGISFVSCTEAIDTSLPTWGNAIPDHRSHCAVGAITDFRESKGRIATRARSR